jgi:drug/metabolite transporter (DMT)-like permease
MVLLAFLLVILSAVLHALWNFLTKRVSGSLSVLYLGIIYACLMLAPFVLLLPTSYIPVPSAFRFIIATGVIHALYFFLLSQAYKHGNISTVYPVARGFGVVGTALLAVALLREQISAVGIIGIASVCAGILLIGTGRGGQAGHTKGLRFALLVGATMVGYSIVDKMAVATIDPVVYIFCLFLLSTVLLTPHIVVAKRQELFDAWKNHRKESLLIGLGATSGYLLILYAFRLAQASYVVAGREFSVVIGSLMGIVYLHEPLFMSKILGMILVILGLIMIRVA